METANTITLKEQLIAQEAIVNSALPEEFKQGNESMIKDLTDQEFQKKALKVGEEVENFTLTDAFGKNVSLAGLLSKGPVVLTFYRGNWCPFCNVQLAALQKHLPEFQKSNATLVAISAEKPDKSMVTVEKHKLTFPILSDYKNVVAKKFGIIFVVPEYLVATFKKFGLDLENHYENQEILLPIPSTFVIGKDFKVKYAFSSEDFTKRPEPSDIRKALQQL